MMIFALNSREHKGNKEKGEVKGEYGGVCGEEEGNADYGGMVQSSRQHVAPCVKLFGYRTNAMITLQPGVNSCQKQKSFDRRVNVENE